MDIQLPTDKPTPEERLTQIFEFSSSKKDADCEDMFNFSHDGKLILKRDVKNKRLFIQSYNLLPIFKEEYSMEESVILEMVESKLKKQLYAHDYSVMYIA